MSMQYPKANHNHASEYQVSGIPYVTSSAANEVTTSTPVVHRFPYVTQWVKVINTDASHTLYVGFSENGVKAAETGNRFALSKAGTAFDNPNSSTDIIHVRCKELWFLGGDNSASFTIVAGLTNCKSREFPSLTGSAGFEGVG